MKRRQVEEEGRKEKGLTGIKSKREKREKRLASGRGRRRAGEKEKRRGQLRKEGKGVMKGRDYSQQARKMERERKWSKGKVERIGKGR